MKTSENSALKKVGLTGGIASGKSLVSKMLQEKEIHVIDMDALGRELTDDSPTIIREISKICGKNVFNEGKLDRSKVREAVFSNNRMKKDLENLLHPLILREFEDRCEAAFESGERLIVCEAALLIESGHYKAMQELIVVLAPKALRKQRLMERDGIDEELAEKMIDSQIDDEIRKQQATHTLNNDGDPKALSKQLSPILKAWKKQGH